MNTPEQVAQNIVNKVEELSEQAAERYDRIHGRTEDWLNESFRRIQVKRVVRDVLIDYLLSK